MSLTAYIKKRNFSKTAEPKGATRKKAGARAGEGRSFVIQKHDATRLHYDFRLELGGTLKSWAVPKGVPYAKGEKHLAVHVEDHPLEYAGFEGTIPKGQYGGGTVMIWDTGTWEPLSTTPEKDLAGGKLHLRLHGKKLNGEWYLTRMRGGWGDGDKENWLLIKAHEDMRPVSAKADDQSIVTGRTMKQIAAGKGGENVWHSNRESSSETTLAKRARAAAADRDTETAATKARSPKTPSRARERREETHARSANGRTKNKSARAPKKKGINKVGHPERSVAEMRDPEPPAETPLTTKSPKKASAKKPTPLRFIPAMKATLRETPPAEEGWSYELKFDGYRALALKHGDTVELFSLNAKDFTRRFPEVTAAIAKLPGDQLALDGEIVALDEEGRSSFGLLQDAHNTPVPIAFYAFDLLHLDGEDLTRRPLTERRAALEEVLRHAKEPIRYSAEVAGDAKLLLQEVCKRGLEGVIGKRIDSPYEPGTRSKSWIKLKCLGQQELVIGGYTPPEGTRQHFGALLVGYYEGEAFKFAGKVGTGFDHANLRALYRRMEAIRRDTCPFSNLPEKTGGRWSQNITPGEMRKCRWVEPQLVCQLRFTEWTKDGKLRHPVFLGLREDKAAREVTREKPAT